MKNRATRYRAPLAWYPRAWRARYGEELVAFLEDTYEGRRVPFSSSISMARAGLSERVRSAGLAGDSLDPATSVTRAALLILCSWSAFVISGSVFAKYVEHWDAVTAPSARNLPTFAYDTVQVGAILGASVLALALLIAAPSLLRSRREQGWPVLVRSLRLASFSGLSALSITIALVVWAHALPLSAHSSGPWSYRVVFALWAILVAFFLVTLTTAGVRVANRLAFGARALRALGVLAIIMTLALGVIFAGVLIWWVAIAQHAPWFFSGAAVGSRATPVPAVMVVVGVVMLVAFGAGLWGALRIISRGRGVLRASAT
jgi:hypothetical protein